MRVPTRHKICIPIPRHDTEDITDNVHEHTFKNSKKQYYYCALYRLRIRKDKTIFIVHLKHVPPTTYYYSCLNNYY